MVPVADLWLPILLSSIAVFMASSLVWTVLPHHRNDFSPLPEEEAVRKKLREKKPDPGLYSIPFLDRKDPDLQSKMEEGPVGLLTVLPDGLPRMGRNMLLTFVYYVLVCTVVGYLTGVALGPGSHYMTVFRVAGTAALLGFIGSLAPTAIWFGRPWRVLLKDIVDGAVYALLTAGFFGWLWPQG